MAKRSYHHGNLRGALITAALKEIAQSGPEAFSLREVARRAGVSAPAVYRHFKAKGDLLAAVAAECLDRCNATLDAAVAKAPDDPLERFRATGIAYVQFAVMHPEHFRVMSLPGLVANLPAAHRESWHERDHAERVSLLRAQAEGTIADIPYDAMMLAAHSITHGLAMMIIEGQLGDVDVARATALAIEVTDVLGDGLRPRAKATKLRRRTR